MVTYSDRFAPKTDRRIDQDKAAPATMNQALREIAGRIKGLSYNDMLRLAAEMTHTDNLGDPGAVHATAHRLLNAAHNLTEA